MPSQGSAPVHLQQSAHADIEEKQQNQKKKKEKRKNGACVSPCEFPT